MNDESVCPITRAAHALMPSRGRPRAQEAGQVGERLLDAAWTVLLANGPEVLTLDKVAAQARASKQTIYARHAGKRDLLLAVLGRRVDQAIIGLDVLPDLPTPHAAFAQLLERALAAFNLPEKLMLDRMIDWIDSNGDHSTARPTRVALADRFRALVEAHLAQAEARWGLKLEDRGLAARFWIYGVVGHMRCAVPGDVDAKVWSRAFTEYFLRGIAGLEH
jgi:AcrR family transcriptional regulator